MIRKICDFFKRAKQILWPKVDSCSEVQRFIDVMCAEYDVPAIEVIVKSKQWVSWFAGKGVSACAFWPKDEEDKSGRYIAFDGETCRISGRDRNTPIRIDHRWQVAEKMHTIIHEFIHHYFHHHYGINTQDHCKKFRGMEKQINAEYGIYYVYGSNRYGKHFHNFWGWPYGNSKPTAKDRGWLA
uniref:SprT-like domain-containing protein n=1 Tax=uncultured marine group II/III euryarchaeote KM3_136_C10 TaxID=1457867 RepID=A0A075G9D7_9EURY|nr:hypothetical protein [uncultured marine group II/III euryarchaeote KM3_136_C10]